MNSKTEDHHGNSSVKVHKLVKSSWILSIVMVTQDDQPQEGTISVNKPNLSDHVSYYIILSILSCTLHIGRCYQPVNNWMIILHYY